MGSHLPTSYNISIFWNNFYEKLKKEIGGESDRRATIELAKLFLEDAYGAAYFLEHWLLFGTAEIPSGFFKKLEAYGLVLESLAENKKIKVKRTGEGFKNEIADYLGFLEKPKDNEEKKIVLKFFGKISEVAGKEGIYWRFPKAPPKKAPLSKAE